MNTGAIGRRIVQMFEGLQRKTGCIPRIVAQTKVIECLSKLEELGGDYLGIVSLKMGL